MQFIFVTQLPSCLHGYKSVYNVICLYHIMTNYKRPPTHTTPSKSTSKQNTTLSSSTMQETQVCSVLWLKNGIELNLTT